MMVEEQLLLIEPGLDVSDDKNHKRSRKNCETFLVPRKGFCGTGRCLLILINFYLILCQNINKSCRRCVPKMGNRKIFLIAPSFFWLICPSLRWTIPLYQQQIVHIEKFSPHCGQSLLSRVGITCEPSSQIFEQ